MGAVIRGLSWAWCAIEYGWRETVLLFGFIAADITSGTQEMNHYSSVKPSFFLFSVILCRIYSCGCTLNKLDTSTHGNYVIYRNLWALSSTLVMLGTLQPWALQVSKSRSSLGLSVCYLTYLHNKIKVRYFLQLCGSNVELLFIVC